MWRGNSSLIGISSGLGFLALASLESEEASEPVESAEFELLFLSLPAFARGGSGGCGGSGLGVGAGLAPVSSFFSLSFSSSDLGFSKVTLSMGRRRNVEPTAQVIVLLSADHPMKSAPMSVSLRERKHGFVDVDGWWLAAHVGNREQIELRADLRESPVAVRAEADVLGGIAFAFLRRLREPRFADDFHDGAAVGAVVTHRG